MEVTNYKTPEQKWFTWDDIEDRIAQDLITLGIGVDQVYESLNGPMPLSQAFAQYIMKSALSVITTDDITTDDKTMFKAT